MALSLSNLCLTPMVGTNVTYLRLDGGHEKQLDLSFHYCRSDIVSSQHFLSHDALAKQMRRFEFK